MVYIPFGGTGTTILHNVEDVKICEVESRAPFVTFVHEGTQKRLDCRYVAGCDGFHGVSRKTIPAEKRSEFDRVYPFGWLGVLSNTKPANEELIYANSSNGFALASMRSETMSRYYVQVSTNDRVEDWSDDRFWDKLQKCLPRTIAASI